MNNPTKKKLLGLLLSLCMAANLPVSARADGVSPSVTLDGKTLTVKGYDSPAYSVNTNAEQLDDKGNKFTAVTQTVGGDASNWNARLIWHSGEAVPTLYLKNFIVDAYNEQTSQWQKTNTAAIAIPAGQPTRIVITGGNSQLKTRFGITYKSNLEIKSEGSAKLSIWNRSSAITSDSATGCALTLDANLDLFVQSYHDASSHILQTNQADLTVNGGNIKIYTDDEKSLFGIVTRSSGNIIINGGNLDVTSSIGAAPANGTIQSSGKLIISGGTIKATAKAATALYAKNGIEINGGLIDILSPYYGINAGTPDSPADIAIHGGTLKISAQRAFFTHPVLGEGVFAYAGADEASAKTYDGTYTPMARQPWMLTSNDPQQAKTEPTTVPVTESTAAPTEAPTAPPAKNPNRGIDPRVILWVAAAGAIGLIGLLVTLIVFKFKKS